MEPAPLKDTKKEPKKKNALWSDGEDDDADFLKPSKKPSGKAAGGMKLPGMVAGITKPSEAKEKEKLFEEQRKKELEEEKRVKEMEREKEEREKQEAEERERMEKENERR